METNEFKEANTSNPFINQDYLMDMNHEYTQIDDIVEYPFKTLNRILDDIKWSIPYKNYCNDKSLLNGKPIDYSKSLAGLVSSQAVKSEILLLNNDVPHCKNISIVQLNDHNENQTMTIIRGLIIINRKTVHHFRIQMLENVSPFFERKSTVTKYEYHVIPKDKISGDDLKQFGSDNLMLDEGFFATNNEDTNHLLRIVIFGSEFSDDDLKLLTDSSIITTRYKEYATKKGNIDVDANVTGLNCMKKLISVLKGPILLEHDAPIRTIDLNETSLESFVDVNYLTDKLYFRLADNKLQPPALYENFELKESYIRKVLELIYRAKMFKVHDNDFNAIYSFNDNLSLIFRTFNEFDKHLGQTFGQYNDSTTVPSYVDLSCSDFFQDELIIKCFENTVRSDVDNKIFYVDDLKTIMKHKTSGKLKSYFDNLYRSGQMYGYSDYVQALNKLKIEHTNQKPEELLIIDDEYVISVYEVSVESDFKNYGYFNNALEVIGTVKQSSKIIEFLKSEIIPVFLAQQEVGIEEITEDDVVITAFEYKLNDLALQPNNNDEIKTLNKSLLSLAYNRKSSILMNYLETKFPDLLFGYTNVLTLRESFEILKLNEKSNDFEMITHYQEMFLLKDIRLLRQALRSINSIKRSKILNYFLRTGKIDSSLLPVDEWPAGLANIGNTCYLNSLLQYYFSIKPLRDMVLNFEESDIKGDRKIGGRKIDDNEIQRSNQFIYHLQKLFQEMIETDQRYVSPSKDLAFLSFLPSSQPVSFIRDDGNKENPIMIDSDVSSMNESIEEINPFDEKAGDDAMDEDMGEQVESEQVEPEKVGEDVAQRGVEQIKEVNQEIKEVEHKEVIDSEQNNVHHTTNTTDEHQEETDSSVTTPDSPPETKILPINTKDMETTINMGGQQDVTECIENVNFQIETALEPLNIEDDGEQYDLIKQLFYGKIKQTIEPLEGEGETRSSIERFSSLIVNISDHPKDIYDALDNYFNADIISLESGLVKKSLTLHKLPDILQFQVQRVLFDRERLVPYKSIEPIPFFDKIYVDQFLDTQDAEILTKREEVFKWKTEIKELQSQKENILKVDDVSKLTIIDSLITTKQYLESLDESFEVAKETVDYIGEQIEGLRQKVKDIDESIETINNNITHQFDNYKKVGYSIFAIFIHRGEASFGHYWIYIKDPHHKDVYRKYNDDNVTEVPASEIFKFEQGNTATPYYIAYVKEDIEHDYVEPLKRIIKCSGSS